MIDTALLSDMFDLLMEIKELLKAIKENTNAFAFNCEGCYDVPRMIPSSDWVTSGTGKIADDVAFPIEVKDDETRGIMWWDRANGVWRPMRELTLREEQ